MNFDKIDSKGGIINEYCCLLRTLPPKAPGPEDFPCELIPNNLGIIEEFIRDLYASSALNVCEHQRLPMIDSAPPLQFHLVDNAKPVAIHKVAPIPVHWEKSVKRKAR